MDGNALHYFQASKFSSYWPGLSSNFLTLNHTLQSFIAVVLVRSLWYFITACQPIRPLPGMPLVSHIGPPPTLIPASPCTHGTPPPSLTTGNINYVFLYLDLIIQGLRPLPCSNLPTMQPRHLLASGRLSFVMNLSLTWHFLSQLCEVNLVTTL